MAFQVPPVGRTCPPPRDVTVQLQVPSPPSTLSFHHTSTMSFFKRNDPSAPAARRAGQQGGAPSPYERLPADNSSYSSLPPPSQQQPGLPPRRSPAPPSQPDYSQAQPQSYGGQGGYGGQQPQDYGRGGQGGYGGGYPSEKAEYRPQQASPQRGMHGVSTGSGRGV